MDRTPRAGDVGAASSGRASRGASIVCCLVVGDLLSRKEVGEKNRMVKSWLKPCQGPEWQTADSNGRNSVST